MVAKTSMTDMRMCGIKMISWKLGHIRQPFQVCGRSCAEKINMSVCRQCGAKRWRYLIRLCYLSAENMGGRGEVGQLSELGICSGSSGAMMVY
jgi:hypothetical protein